MTTVPASDQQLQSTSDDGLDTVTGAFSYSGSAIASALLASGRQVRTLTGHPDRADHESPIEIRPLDFNDTKALTASLEGTTTLYNTYWVRFARKQIDHDLAVANSTKLFEAAKVAGVQRIVHVSITHPNVNSPLPYFRGKALVEQALDQSGVSYAVLRPAILFGGEGVLINNIAWLLRHLPMFAVGGKGDYRIRGIHIDDLAQLALAKGRERDSSITDAVGPEQPTFLELVHSVRAAVGSHSLVVRVPGAALPPLAGALGLFLRDVLLTKDEYLAMSEGLANTAGPATGSIRLSEWIAENAHEIGKIYANEIHRHFG